MRVKLFFVALVMLFPGVASAQVTATMPTVCNPNALGDCTRSAPVVKPDGGNIGSSFNLTTTQVSVGTTPTLLVAARTSPSPRARIIITQTGAGPCYYSASPTVSPTTGARLTVLGASKTYQYAGALYGICPGGAVTVDVDEEY